MEAKIDAAFILHYAVFAIQRINLVSHFPLLFKEGPCRREPTRGWYFMEQDCLEFAHFLYTAYKVFMPF